MFIHCYGGHDRTGLVVSCLLVVLYNLRPEKAMKVFLPHSTVPFFGWSVGVTQVRYLSLRPSSHLLWSIGPLVLCFQLMSAESSLPRPTRQPDRSLHENSIASRRTTATSGLKSVPAPRAGPRPREGSEGSREAARSQEAEGRGRI